MFASELTIRHVLGFPVHIPARNGASTCAPFDSYLNWIQQRIEQQQPTHTVTVNAEMVMLGRRDEQFARILQTADLLAPDGAGIVLALRLQGVKILRCPGIELSERLVSLAARQRWSVAVVGGQPQVCERVLQQWRARYPDLDVEGHHGYFDAEGEREIVAQMRVQQPQLIFIGLGSPRQEYWIRSHRNAVPQATWIGIGGSLDIWAGTKQRAPQWLRDRHMEWLYRLYKEPWRWQRMLVLPQFAWHVVVNGVLAK
ncbi:WecB/TagA/CpsF family glycosyltransferase [Synechococcus sp. PCC 7336]|uniref:WecB/TagA/CpsF family glycosyltransferase n=1 Tax=Synechococcus sp. PCC 7336 TaxID=195250 RepID=UPI00034D0CA9|nr:WecB/TagA/CpsF family glycosyltransferase [Synechococcus sp. PCC 7336]